MIGQRWTPAAGILDADLAIDAALEGWAKARTPAANAQSLARSGAIHVLGRNALAEGLLSRFPVAGLVDDSADGGLWAGTIPVVPSHALVPGSVVVNCSTAIAPLSAGRRLAAQPGVTVVPYCALIDCQDGCPLPEFVIAGRQDIDCNRRQYRSLEARLQDAESRRILRQLLDFRLTADPAFMESFSVRTRDQYFEPFLGSMDAAVFVDCGGYDGDTTELFAARYPAYARIHCFEPSPSNLALARLRLQGLRDVELIGLGVSDVPGRLAFDAGSGSASAVGGDGDTAIEVTTVDRYLAGPVSFIKMDLEGWELKALAGAERHIRDEAPALAIAVYHDIRDFWRIPQWVLGVRDDYEIALRHYTEGWSETIMYFVPRSAARR